MCWMQKRSNCHYLILRFWMLHVVKNTEDNFEDVIPPMRQECITVSLQYFKHYSEAPVHRQSTSIMKHAPYIETEQNRFGWRTDEIAKFSLLGGKTEFTILDGIWTKNGQMTNQSLEKLSKSTIVATIVAENDNYTMFSIQLSLFYESKIQHFFTQTWKSVPICQ